MARRGYEGPRGTLAHSAMVALRAQGLDPLRCSHVQALLAVVRGPAPSRHQSCWPISCSTSAFRKCRQVCSPSRNLPHEHPLPPARMLYASHSPCVVCPLKLERLFYY
jgi:hypothetical protein